MRRSGLLISLTALACRSLAPIPAPYTPSAQPDTSLPIGMFYTSALAAAGVPALATSDLPAGYREFRLSEGDGLTVGDVHPVLRIVDTPDHTIGEVWWLAGGGGRAALAKVKRAINWGEFVRQLDSLQVPTLAPPVSDVLVHDAGDLTVEVRTGRSYRAYQVTAPLFHNSPAFAAAQVAFHMIDSVFNLAPPR